MDDMMRLRDAQDWGTCSLDEPATRAAFIGWVRESPENLAALLINTALNLELSSLDSARQFDLDALIAAASPRLVQAAPTSDDTNL